MLSSFFDAIYYQNNVAAELPQFQSMPIPSLILFVCSCGGFATLSAARNQVALSGNGLQSPPATLCGGGGSCFVSLKENGAHSKI